MLNRIRSRSRYWHPKRIGEKSVNITGLDSDGVEITECLSMPIYAKTRWYHNLWNKYIYRPRIINRIEVVDKNE